MKKNDWKDRLNIVYSTNPDFNYQLDEEEEPATVDPKQQKLRVSIEKKGRGGKTVTVISGFILAFFFKRKDVFSGQLKLLILK